jgi:hypothetical protein
MDGLKGMPPLAEAVVLKGFHTSNKEGRTSITVLYEFEESRLMEVSRKIFGRRDSFSEIDGFGLSVQLWTDADNALSSIAEMAWNPFHFCLSFYEPWALPGDFRVLISIFDQSLFLRSLFAAFPLPLFWIPFRMAGAEGPFGLRLAFSFAYPRPGKPFG